MFTMRGRQKAHRLIHGQNVVCVGIRFLLRLTDDTHDPVSPDRARIDFDGLTSDSAV
jgi:hypothetical protein